VERLTLPAKITSVRPFCEFARRKAEAAAFTAEELNLLDLTIEEIVVNIARYAYDSPETGTAELACAVEGPHRLRLEISDEGRKFNPLDSNPPDFTRGLADRPVGGLGVFLVKSIAESIVYQRDGNRNIIAFTFA
jgi:serine/threonine-protein kinase RsbW